MLYGLVALVLVFILWMNVTPGHFQHTCGRVEYTDKTYRLHFVPGYNSDQHLLNPTPLINCSPQDSILDQVILFSAKVDFNK
jgi:hypothetical protein